MTFFSLNRNKTADKKVTFVWAHGWGQNHEAFLPLMKSFESRGAHHLIDFPGFGQSTEPKEAWGTEDYADDIANWLRENYLGSVIWIGHSFGCRVGLQLATRHPDLVDGLFLIAAAGLKRQRSSAENLRIKIRTSLYKFCKKLIPFGLSQEWLIHKFGASDYKNATGIMRQIFVRVVNEDLSQIAKDVQCPVTLIYGEEDTETPPEIGARFERMISDSKLYTLTGQDHYSVLLDGRHQVAHYLSQFLERLNKN